MIEATMDELMQHIKAGGKLRRGMTRDDLLLMDEGGMTREEAIKIIKKCKEKGFKYTLYTLNEYHAALEMAIKALRREDTFLDNVLEIIDKSTAYVKELDETVADKADGMMAATSAIRKAVEALKEGE